MIPYALLERAVIMWFYIKSVLVKLFYKGYYIWLLCKKYIKKITIVQLYGMESSSIFWTLNHFQFERTHAADGEVTFQFFRRKIIIEIRLPWYIYFILIYTHLHIFSLPIIFANYVRRCSESCVRFCEKL